MLGLPALIGFNSLSKPIISILTTPRYYGGQLIFPFVSTGALFMGLYSLSYTGLIIHEKSRLIAKIIAVSAILNVLLNLVLIPYYGFIGAGISTVIAYFVALEILIGCIIYFLVLYILGGVEKEEINEMKMMIRNMCEKA
jgi:O-antigen/teichoic acid export membrane protein